MSIDISDIARENHDYAIHLATSQNVIAYRNGSFLLLDASFGKYPFEVVDFWRNLSLATEILLKASLLRHHIPFFRKRGHAEYGERVTADTNPWLQTTLEEMQISYVAQINTGTANMGTMYEQYRQRHNCPEKCRERTLPNPAHRSRRGSTDL